MQRFKTAVNTVIANIQDKQSRKAFEKIQKEDAQTEELTRIGTLNAERILQRMGLFDKKRNDIKLLIQRNIITEKDIELVHTTTYEDNKDIKKLKKTLELFKNLLLSEYNTFKYKKKKLTREIIVDAFKKIEQHLEINKEIIITLENIENFSKLLETFISNFITKLLVPERYMHGKQFSDVKVIYKYIVIILAINTKLINYSLIINILNNNTNSKSIIKDSLSSQSPDTRLFSDDDVMKFVNKNFDFSYDLSFNPKNIKKVYKEAHDNYKNIKKYFDSFNVLLDRLKRTLALLSNLFIRNSSIFHYRSNGINTIISQTTLDKELLKLNNLISTIKDQKITKEIINKFYKEVDEIDGLIYYPFRGTNSSIKLKPNIKVGDFQKGYKDFKNYLRYINIIANLRSLLVLLPIGDKITYNSISPKSSLRSYKSSYKKDLSANYKKFNNLSPEPVSAIKSSPKYSTYYAEK